MGSKITLVALSMVLGYSAFQKAGVAWSDWIICVVAIGFIAAARFFVTCREQAPPLDSLTVVAGLAVLCTAALQIIPLPIRFIGLVSPARIELLNATRPLSGQPPAYATLSATPHETINYLLTITAYALVFLLIRDLAFRSENRWIVMWPVLIVATLEAALGFVQAYSGELNAFASGTYVNRDHFAGLLEMALSFAAIYVVAILRREEKRFESPAKPAISACIAIACAVLLLIGILHSLSRMGFLTALAELFVGAVFAISLRGWREDYRTVLPLWRRALPIGAIALVVAMAFIYLPSDPLIARFSDLAKTDDISADTRSQIWRDTTSLIKAVPLFGCGLGSYESCFMRFKTVAPMNTVDYAHNDYLQVLSELGIIGFAGGALFVIRILIASIRGAFYARSVDGRWLAVGCIGSITAILLHSLVDFNMYVPANALVFSWILGVAGTNLRAQRRSPEPDNPKVTANVASCP